MKESILFIMKYPTCLKETLVRKFNGEMDSCVSLGYEVWYIEWNGREFLLRNRNNNTGIFLYKSHCIVSRSRYYHSLCFSELYLAACKALKKQHFDYVYFREMPLCPPAKNLFKIIDSSDTFFIYEIPTYIKSIGAESVKQTNKMSLPRFILSRLSKIYQKGTLNFPDFFVVIGDDCGKMIHNKPAVNISNGIDITSIPMKRTCTKDNTINVLLLASMCYWHGYDRIIEGLKGYKGDQSIVLHFVGNAGDDSLNEWQKMVNNYELHDLVVFHGPVYGEELNQLIDSMDIAVGSLGLHRLNLSSASTMKSREYMARGIPFIYAGEDPTIEEGFPYVLNVPDNEDPISISDLVNFANRMKSIYEVPAKMRNYAFNHFSWHHQMRKVFQELNEGRQVK